MIKSFFFFFFNLYPFVKVEVSKINIDVD